MAEDKEKKRIRGKKYRLEHKEELNAKARIYYWIYAEKNKIRREKYREDNAEQIKEYMDMNREKYRDNKLKKIYGMSVAEYNERLKEQDGKCGICGKEVNKLKNKVINFNIDHDHETREIRGLLCNKCNLALTSFEENLKLDENFMQKVKNYLLEIK